MLEIDTFNPFPIWQILLYVHTFLIVILAIDDVVKFEVIMQELLVELLIVHTGQPNW